MKARTYRKHVANKQKEQEATGEASPTTSTDTVVAAIVAELPGLLAVAVVETDSGTTVAAHSCVAGLNPATAATHNAQVIKLKMKAMEALSLSQERLEDVLITLTNQLHLLMLNQDGSRFLYLVVSARDTSLAMARAVLRANINQLD